LNPVGAFPHLKRKAMLLSVILRRLAGVILAISLGCAAEAAGAGDLALSVERFTCRRTNLPSNTGQSLSTMV